MKLVFKRLGLFLALALVGAAGESTAQGFPNKSIKLVVGLTPGGGTDILARLIGQKLTDQIGQQVIVEVFLHSPGWEPQRARRGS